MYINISSVHRLQTLMMSISGVQIKYLYTCLSTNFIRFQHIKLSFPEYLFAINEWMNERFQFYNLKLGNCFALKHDTIIYVHKTIIYVRTIIIYVHKIIIYVHTIVIYVHTIIIYVYTIIIYVHTIIIWLYWWEYIFSWLRMSVCVVCNITVP